MLSKFTHSLLLAIGLLALCCGQPSSQLQAVLENKEASCVFSVFESETALRIVSRRPNLLHTIAIATNTSTIVRTGTTDAEGVLEFPNLGDIGPSSALRGSIYLEGAGRRQLLAHCNFVPGPTQAQNLCNDGTRNQDETSVDCGGVCNRVSTKNRHTCAIFDCETYCWGNNLDGAVGSESSERRFNTPQAVRKPSDVSRFIEITTGYRHTCGIAAEGSLWCWGHNEFGQLGTGTTGTGTTTPVRVGSETDWLAVAAGERHSCGLRDGRIYCWGANDEFQQGRPALASSALAPTPSLVETGTTSFSEIQVGESHSCSLTPAGVVYCWGAGRSGQLGTGDTLSLPTPVRLATNFEVRQLSNGHNATWVADSKGQVWALGFNNRPPGSLGTGLSSHPVVQLSQALEGAPPFATVRGGDAYACATTDSGEGYCWGDGSAGRLGTGGTEDELSLGAPLPGAVWRLIQPGFATTCGLQRDGSIWCWGFNDFGQVGNGVETSQLEPSQILPVPGI